MKHESLIVLCYLQASSNLLIFQGKKYSFFFIIIPSFLGLLMILIMSLKAYIMTILKVFFGCIKNIKKFFIVLYSILYQEIFFPVILSVLDLKNAHDWGPEKKKVMTDLFRKTVFLPLVWWKLSMNVLMLIF